MSGTIEMEEGLDDFITPENVLLLLRYYAHLDSMSGYLFASLLLFLKANIKFCAKSIQDIIPEKWSTFFTDNEPLTKNEAEKVDSAFRVKLLGDKATELDFECRPLESGIIPDGLGTADVVATDGNFLNDGIVPDTYIPVKDCISRELVLDRIYSAIKAVKVDGGYDYTPLCFCELPAKLKHIKTRYGRDLWHVYKCMSKTDCKFTMSQPLWERIIDNSKLIGATTSGKRKTPGDVAANTSMSWGIVPALMRKLISSTAVANKIKARYIRNYKAEGKNPPHESGLDAEVINHLSRLGYQGYFAKFRCDCSPLAHEKDSLKRSSETKTVQNREVIFETLSFQCASCDEIFLLADMPAEALSFYQVEINPKVQKFFNEVIHEINQELAKNQMLNMK